MHRWVLGTVQLGLPYARRSEVPTAREAEAILDGAWELGIRAFDTAEAYGESPARLAAWLAARNVGHEARMVTKVQLTDDLQIARRTRQALARFPRVGHLAILVHGWAGEAVWEIFHRTAAGCGAATGLSVYEESQVSAAAGYRGIECIQAPANVFNTAAFTARGDAPVRLDLRSVFLQGLLLETPEAAESRVSGGGRLAAAIRQAAAEVGEDSAPLLLGAMLLRLRDGDRLVVGIDHTSQLEALKRAVEIPAAYPRDFSRRLRQLVAGGVEANILDPRTW